MNPLERFAKLEKIDKPNDDRGRYVEDLKEVTGEENIIIPCTKARFYDLYDIYDPKDVKIFQTEDWRFWVVMKNE